jgi:hypothetical protein
MAKKQFYDTFEIWGDLAAKFTHSVRIFSSKPAVHARRA